MYEKEFGYYNTCSCLESVTLGDWKIPFLVCCVRLSNSYRYWIIIQTLILILNLEGTVLCLLFVTILKFNLWKFSRSLEYWKSTIQLEWNCNIQIKKIRKCRTMSLSVNGDGTINISESSMKEVFSQLNEKTKMILLDEDHHHYHRVKLVQN